MATSMTTVQGYGSMRVVIEGIGDIAPLLAPYEGARRLPFRLGEIDAEAFVTSAEADYGRDGITCRVEVVVLPKASDGDQ